MTYAYLAHSSRRGWSKHKYIAKVRTKTGKIRYIYEDGNIHREEVVLTMEEIAKMPDGPEKQDAMRRYYQYAEIAGQALDSVRPENTPLPSDYSRRSGPRSRKRFGSGAASARVVKRGDTPLGAIRRNMAHCDIYSDELYHHGIKGMRWGIRRYRNEDGTLTEKGIKRADKLKKKLAKSSAYAKGYEEFSKESDAKIKELKEERKNTKWDFKGILKKNSLSNNIYDEKQRKYYADRLKNEELWTQKRLNRKLKKLGVDPDESLSKKQLSKEDVGKNVKRAIKRGQAFEQQMMIQRNLEMQQRINREFQMQVERDIQNQMIQQTIQQQQMMTMTAIHHSMGMF